MSGQPGHFVELKIEGEKLQRGFKCTMPADAPCRRRPKDHELRESWTEEESTESGLACWAVEWVDAVGIEEAIFGGEFDGVLASVPVSIAYEECVSIEPLAGATAPNVELDAARAVIVQIRRYLERFNPGGTRAQDAMAQALENILGGEQVAWAPSDDKPLPDGGDDAES